MNGNTSYREPSPPYLEVKKEIDGYEVSAGFYPGFVRAIEVNGVVLYEQKADGPYPFCLPADEPPLTSSVLTLSSSKGYRVPLNLDSTQSMDQLQLVLHPPRETKGGVTAFQDL